MGKDAVTIGLYVSGQAVEAVSSRGHETVIRTQAVADPEAWLELVVYGISLDTGTEVRAAFAFAAETTREFEFDLRRKSRDAGFHKIQVVPALEAARRGLGSGVPERVPLIVLDPVRSQLGVEDQIDWVRPIAGREARELAVSLRCLIKPLTPAKRRECLERVVIVGPPEVVDAFGRARLEKELSGIGARRLDIRHEPLALARGALNFGEQSPRSYWRRVARS